MATFGNFTTSPNTPPTTAQSAISTMGPAGGLTPEGNHMEPTIGQIWPR
jgi:hypothetical protein